MIHFPSKRILISLVSIVLCEWSSAFGVTPLPTISRSKLPTSSTQQPSSPQQQPLQMSATNLNLHEEQVELSSGVSMKVEWALPSNPAAAKNKSPLVFLHGSFHGGWCWIEHFVPYFVALGYPVVAINWRGTGGTFAGEGVKKVQMDLHVSDLKAVLEEFVPSKLSQRNNSKKPILISHSFGGLSIMKFLEKYKDEGLSSLGGAIIMCSVPPSGNGRMTMRFLRRSLRASWKITKGLAMKKVLTDAALCRELFFGGLGDDHEVSDADVQRYMQYFERDSAATIDLMDLAKQLPSAQTNDNGQALFLAESSLSETPPFLVVGATEDFIVDQEGNEETAAYFGLKAPVIVDSPHDVMIGKKWENAANVIEKWLQDNHL